MANRFRTDERVAKERRARAIARGELRSPTSPRVSSSGVTSFAVKAEDPETRAMIDAFLARDSGQ